ncbi:MAG: transcription-repair coupling factor, partial [Gordonia sp. (in: high G+C Gram-positive bacteria)]
MSTPAVSRPSLSGLVPVAFRDAAFGLLRDRADQAQLAITAPDAARPFVVAQLASGGDSEAERPVLVVAANGREADDLTAELTELLPTGPHGTPVVAQFPSWETLPHERLSPSADTVGQRLAVLSRLADPTVAPLRV